MAGLEARAAELRAEIARVEAEKRRVAERNRKMEGERGLLEKQAVVIAEEVARYAKEAKGLKIAKSATGQVFEKKIATLEAELKAIMKETQKMRDEIDLYYDRVQKDQAAAMNTRKFELFGTDDDDFEKAVAVKAKPRLFGEQD